METKTELSLLAIDCVGVIFSAPCSDWNIILRIRLLEHATRLTPLVRAATWPECPAAGTPWIYQEAAGELHLGLFTSHHLQELQRDVNFLSGFKANVSLMLRPPHQGWSWPGLLLPYITVILLKKTFSINHHRAQETPAERLQHLVFGSSHFWQLSSIPHVLTLIVMSSASRLHTAQVAWRQMSSLFYYSWDLIGL